MSAYDFVHLALLASGGKIKGKTNVQKLVYFLGLLTGKLEDLGYRPHFYGPYSAEVAGAIDRLKAMGFLDENIASGGTIDERGFEVARHDFRLNSEGRRLAESKAEKNQEFFERLRGAVALLTKTGERDYMKLSVAAKTYFMLGEKKNTATIGELSALARRFGWSVSSQEVKEAAEFLRQIGLVELSDATAD